MGMRSAFAWVVIALALACSPVASPPVRVEPDAGPVLPTGGVCLDNDGDGVGGSGDCSTAAAKDCDDVDPTVHPGAAETCNGVDDDCDGERDEGLPILTYFRDVDGDGFGNAETGSGCGPAPAGDVTRGGDCNDTNKDIRPEANETCNGEDDDCDGKVDDGLTFRDFYPDADGDGHGAVHGVPSSSCQAAIVGKSTAHGDCDDQNPTVKPSAMELCNKVDDDCDGQVDNGISFHDYYPDADGDGFGAAAGTAESSCSTVPGKVRNRDDCNDQSPSVKPGAPELCNGVDDNCDGSRDEGLAFVSYWPDGDGDGFGAAGGAPVSACLPIAGRVANDADCNDGNPAMKPEAPEVCNGLDDDCNAQVDDGLTFASYYPDADGDGHGAKTGAALSACVPVAGRVTNNGDCNDVNAAVKPGAPETCNGVDDDCNAQVDDGLAFSSYWPDADGDGHGAASASAQVSCTPVNGKVTNNTDCDDARSAVRPGADEGCNGVDDNCNGPADEGLTFANYYPDVDGDGFGAVGSTAQSWCAPVAGKVANDTDCNDGRATAYPGAPESCNNADDNCDGQVDNGTVTQSYYPDVDGDGFGATNGTAQVSCAPVAGRVTNNTDCNDASASVRPGAAEVCNGADDNCDAQADNGLTFLSYYPDLDGDGFGAAGATAQSACASVAGKVTSNTDCNDGNLHIHPGKAELCDGVDQDCDAQVDEGLPTQIYYPDADGDGHGAVGGAAVASCGPVTGRVPSQTDCNDGSAAIHPGAAETCNNLDDNCSGQADEENPGGGASCNTGQAGVCAAGQVTCQGGALTCVRNAAPTAELCNGADDDCDNSVDETFTNKGLACTSGLGVCRTSGTYGCKADGSGTQCSATLGSPTAAACDGLDNDCDGVVDEPALSTTTNLHGTAWTDLELVPYYHSAGACAGGVAGTGTDALAGGALVMAGGTGGLFLQRLDATGAPTGSPTFGASSLTYVDAAIAQAGDGFVMAGIWRNAGGTPIEIDLYYMDAATGTKRAQVWGQFNTGNALDSLRLVRANGRRVVLVWREANVGLRLARVEPVLDTATHTWSVRNVGGGASPLSSTLLVAGAGIQPGVGADSNHVDWEATQACAAAASLRSLKIAYRPDAQAVHAFDVLEDGSGKGADVVVKTMTGSYSLDEPEVAFFRAGSADHWVVAYTQANAGATVSNEDLYFWMSTDRVNRYTYLSLASENGADSIRRPRVSVSSSRLWLSAVRFVADPSGFKRQVMTRKVDFTGQKDPTSSAVELSFTAGGCGADPACRPGEKDGLTSWAATGRVYYSGSGAIPAGTYASTLTCQ